MDKVIIIGGKGTALCIAEQIVDASKSHGAKVEFIGWAIDDPALGSSIDGFPVLCKTTEALSRFPKAEIKFLFALYKPEEMKARVEILSRLGIGPERFLTFIHPLAYVAKSATVGSGSVVLAHSTIQPNVRIGRFNIINASVVVEHDTVLGDNNFIAAGACLGSEVKVQQGVFIGLNCAIREHVQIGDYAFIGMGSNVLHDVHAGQKVFGNPARPRK